MNKFVQIRFQPSSKSIQNLNHDFRKSKLNYLRNDMFHNKFKNLYFNFDEQEVKVKMKKSYYEYNKLYKKKHKRNLQKGKQSDLLTSIITLSPIINIWLADGSLSKEDLENCFINSANEVAKKIGVQLFYGVIHYDEKTPHMHLAFANHTQDGKSKWQEMRMTKGLLSEYQDLVGEHFKSIGLRRGVRKSKSRHMSVKEMHQVEANEIIKQARARAKEEQQAIQKEIKALQLNKKEIKQELDTSKEEKKQQLDLLDLEIRRMRDEKEKIKLSLVDFERIEKAEIGRKVLIKEAKAEEEIERYIKEWTTGYGETINAIETQIRDLTNENRALREELSKEENTTISSVPKRPLNELVEDEEERERYVQHMKR